MKQIVLSLALLAIFSGCGEKQEAEDKKKSTVAATAKGIEVVKNENAFKTKIGVSRDDNLSKSYYLGYTEPKNTPDTGRVRTSIDANLHVRSPYQQIQIGLMVDKLSKEFIIRCSACHNDYGNGIIGPSLLDKDAAFIAKKIALFKTDENANVLMSALVKQMDDETIMRLANEIETFNKNLKKLRGN
jgi:cytochrome c553